MAQTPELAIDKPKESPVKAHHAHTALALDAPSIASSTSDTIPEDAHKSTFVSKGESVHKWGSYLGVDWLFNTATGVSFAYWGKYTDMGKKLWNEPLTKGFETALKPLIKHPEQLKKSAGYGTMFMSIIAGGMFTIPPLMILEDNTNKRHITEFLDKMIYGKKAVEEDPRFKAAYEEIQNAPKKDFASGLTSRFTALAPMLAMVLIPTTKRISNKYWFNHVEHASEVVANKAGFTAEKLFEKIPAAEAKERWKFIHESVAMDFGLGVPYAILHSIFYNKFANSKEKAKKSDATTPSDNASPTLPTVTPGEDAKQWTAHIAEKPRPIAMARSTGSFSDRIVNQKADMEHQLV